MCYIFNNLILLKIKNRYKILILPRNGHAHVFIRALRIINYYAKIDFNWITIFLTVDFSIFCNAIKSCPLFNIFYINMYINTNCVLLYRNLYLLI